jgi:uncharacterized repeat protein (TIGR01451 family)
VLLSSIANVHAASVIFFKIDSASSTFMDPSQTYNGYTPGTNVRYLIFLNVTTKLGGSVVKITNLTITDTLPTGLTYVSGSQLSDPSAASFSVVGQELIWNWSTTQLSTVVNPPNVANARYQATAEINATVDSTVADNTYLTNNAATGYDVVTPKSVQSDTTYDTVWIARPVLDIAKQSPAEVENGSSFNYILTLNNTGHFDATGVKVTDILPTGVTHTPGTSTASSGSFAVDNGTAVIWTGTIGNVTGTHVVTITIPVNVNTPAKSLYNSANYTAYPCISEFTHTSASCTTTVFHPKIMLTKTPSAPVIENDTSVTYTYNVTNIGDVPLSAVNITDSMYGSIVQGQSLAVGRSVLVTKTVSLIVTTTNTATASGVDQLGKVVTAQSSTTVTVLHPKIMVTKVPSATTVENDTSVTYTYNVTNVGDTPLSAVNVTDNTFGVIASGQSLIVGQSKLFTKTVILTATTTNTATAVGADMLATKVSATATATVTVLHPKIMVTKVPSATTVENDTSVTYTYNVTNVGDTPLNSVSITDSVFGSITSGRSLGVGQSLQLTYTVALTATTTNTATASGTDELSTVVQSQASSTVTVLHPAIKLTKVASATTVESGTSVTYTFNVTNTGDTTLSAVNITDNVYGSIASMQSLAVGQSKVFTKTVVMTSTTTDTATALGVDTLSTKVSATASATVTVLHPAIKLTKVPNATTVNSGSSVTYTFNVTNTGDTALSDVNITDNTYGVIASMQSLAVGQSKVFTKTVVMTSTTTDTATAIGVDTLDTKVSASASATVTVKVPPPPMVGGVSASVNAFNFMATWSSLISLVAAALLLKGLIARKKREKKADAHS